MRLEGWEDRFIAAVSHHAERPFSWSGSDCFRLMMDNAEAVTGTNPYGDEFDRYTTRRGAALRLKRRGFSSLEQAVASVYEPCQPSLARRADIGFVEYQGELCGVVVLGAELQGKSEAGAIRLPRGLLIRAYSVG